MIISHQYITDWWIGVNINKKESWEKKYCLRSECVLHYSALCWLIYNCLIWVIASDYSQRDCLKGYFLFRPYSCPFEGRVYLLIFSVEREKSNLIHDLDTGFCWRSIIHANPFQCNHYLLMICNLLITMVKYGQAISVKINTTIFDVN